MLITSFRLALPTDDNGETRTSIWCQCFIGFSFLACFFFHFLFRYFVIGHLNTTVIYRFLFLKEIFYLLNTTFFKCHLFVWPPWDHRMSIADIDRQLGICMLPNIFAFGCGHVKMVLTPLRLVLSSLVPLELQRQVCSPSTPQYHRPYADTIVCHILPYLVRVYYSSGSLWQTFYLHAKHISATLCLSQSPDDGDDPSDKWGNIFVFGFFDVRLMMRRVIIRP